MRIRTALIVCCFLIAVTSLNGCSCGSAEPALDKSLLISDPCMAPCWHDLVPGVSSEDDVRNQLENSPYVKKGTLKYTEIRGLVAKFSWLGQGEYPNELYLHDDKVLYIIIELDYDLTLGEVVSRYGPPERVRARLSSGDFIAWTVDFYYPKQGLLFESDLQYEDPSEPVVSTNSDGKLTTVISEDLTVWRVYYFAPRSFQDMLTEVFLASPEEVEYYLANTHIWEGFGRRIEFAEW